MNNYSIKIGKTISKVIEDFYNRKTCEMNSLSIFLNLIFYYFKGTKYNNELAKELNSSNVRNLQNLEAP